MKEEISCGVVVVRKEKEKNFFLILRMIDGHLGFSKGHIEENETTKETALRELKEETGISKIKLLNFPLIIESYNFSHNNSNIHKVNKYFIGYTDIDKVVIQEEEISEYMWVTYDQAFKILDFESSKKVLQTANNYIKSSFLEKIGFINK